MKNFVAGTCFLLVLCCSEAAIATPISFEMTGSISDIRGTITFPDSVFVGAPFVAELTYDLSAPDEFPDDPQQGFYRHRPPTAANGLAFSVGGVEFSSNSDDDFYVGVFNDLTHRPFLDYESLPPRDYLVVKTSGYFGGRDIGFIWTDPTGSVFSNDQLPQRIDSARFIEPTIAVSAWGPDIGETSVFFSVAGTVAEVHGVPEPDSTLVALSLLLMLFLVKVGMPIVRKSATAIGPSVYKSSS